MSSQHKAPLAAFFVVSIACIVVVVNALRSDALSGLFVNPTQAVVAGARLVPAPHDLLSVEGEVVARASAGLAAAPTVVDQVVDRTVAVPAATHHRARHASTASAAPAVAAPVAVAPPTAPLTVTPAEHAVRGHGPHTAPTGTAPAGRPSPAVSAAHGLGPAYGRQGHQSDSAPLSHGHGWGRMKPKHEDGRHAGRGQAPTAAQGAHATAAASVAQPGHVVGPTYGWSEDATPAYGRSNGHHLH